MSDQSQRVEETEFVLRRIHQQHVEEGAPFPILATGFRPTENDTTGISFFREKFLSHPTVALSSVDAAKQNNYFLVRLAIRDIYPLELTMLPEPDPEGPPGHAVIPELSWSAYQADKDRLKKIQYELAKLACNGIVHRPSQ
jgi:hypothetical protein